MLAKIVVNCKVMGVETAILWWYYHCVNLKLKNQLKWKYTLKVMSLIRNKILVNYHNNNSSSYKTRKNIPGLIKNIEKKKVKLYIIINIHI